MIVTRSLCAPGRLQHLQGNAVAGFVQELVLEGYDGALGLPVSRPMMTRLVFCHRLGVQWTLTPAPTLP
jgi:hypothetical protein